MKDEEDVDIITEFLKKKRNSLEHLKIHITKVTLLESSDRLAELINAIDNLPKLTSLRLSHKVSFVVKTARETILPELDLSFKNLFSKPILMKKFKVALNQFRFSHEGLMNILQSVQKNSSALEKISIDIAKHNIKTKVEVGFMLDFLSSLTNIRSLKLFGMGVSTRQFFSELVDVICTLQYLRVFYIGEVSAKVTQATFVEGVEKVLSKNGIEKFICETSADFKKALAKKTKASPPDIDLEKIKKKNPFLKDRPPGPIYTPEDRDEMWKVGNKR